MGGCRKAVAVQLFLTLIFSIVVLVAGNRVVQGKVIDAKGKPVVGAAVYVKDMRKLTVRSFVSTPDGGFRFGSLSADTDYEVWADLKGHKSETKTTSSFDTKKVFDFTLVLQ
jgi:hypothetical protein